LYSVLAKRASVLLLSILSGATAAIAQKYEVGLQLTGFHLHKIDETPLGVGARFHYNVTPFLAADAELTHYPENSSGNFGETAALVGVRAGKRLGPIGVFASARPGVIHFGGEFFQTRLNKRTHLIADLGGMIEYYPSRRTFIRVEVGDAVIYYGDALLFNSSTPEALGTVHNFRPGFGFGFRF
jgi:hypothetical protein